MSRRSVDARTLYARYRELVRAEALPCAIVDLDAVDHNTDALLKSVRANKKRLRIASKSIRCLQLLRYVIERGAGTIRGVMAYSAREAEHLAKSGFDDVLIAYPSTSPADLDALVRANRGGRTVSIVADAPEHLDALEPIARAAGAVISVVIEADVSYRPLGQLHIGVRRSPLRSPADVVRMARDIKARASLRLLGVMAYEAQIAGVADATGTALMGDAAKRWMKSRSRPDVKRMRAEIAAALRAEGIAIEVFNGGGTGSLSSASGEDALTEVTAGSGFVASHLFDGYRGLELEPALLFALQVVRASDPDLRTCHGGGYVASGQAGADRLPQPFLPEGLELLPLEGAGEVQTPLRIPAGVDLRIGAPVFFRHAKAGELAEHFNTYLLVRGAEIVERAPTYRGEGMCFL